MLPEGEREKMEDRERVVQRLGENEALGIIATNARVEFEFTLRSTANPHTVSEVDRYGVIREREASNISDLFWVKTLMDAGLSATVILEMWDKKEEKSRSVREAIANQDETY